ncbi:MAG: hypothetical protein ACFCA4_18745 [Cyanophyceae cyanobacterium]
MTQKLKPLEFARSFAKILREAGDPGVVSHPPYIPDYEQDRCRRIFEYLAPFGFSNEQVDAAIAHILDTYEYPGVPKGLGERIRKAVSELRPTPVYSVIDPAVGQLPPAGQQGTAIAQLQGSAEDLKLPNPLLSEAVLTYFDWGLPTLLEPPGISPDDGLPKKYHARIFLAARQRLKSLLGSQWFSKVRTAVRQTGSVDDLVGDRLVFGKSSPWTQPGQEPSAPKQDASPDRKVSRLKGRLPL